MATKIKRHTGWIWSTFILLGVLFLVVVSALTPKWNPGVIVPFISILITATVVYLVMKKKKGENTVLKALNDVRNKCLEIEGEEANTSDVQYRTVGSSFFVFYFPNINFSVGYDLFKKMITDKDYIPLKEMYDTIVNDPVKMEELVARGDVERIANKKGLRAEHEEGKWEADKDYSE